MSPEAQKWRDHFANCERDQLRRFPLCHSPLQDLETGILRSQYEIALTFFQKGYPLAILLAMEERENNPRHPLLELHRKATAFRADLPTREAFYKHFALGPLEDYFCLRTEEWGEVFEMEQQKLGWEDRYSTNWHEFVAVSALSPKQRRFYTFPQNISLETLFLRHWGTLIHPLGGDGGADLWHWTGSELIYLPTFDSMWLS